MTARQGNAPLSRRELRATSRTEAADVVDDGAIVDDADAANGDAAVGPVTSPGGRRVRWDPSATTPLGDGAAATDGATSTDGDPAMEEAAGSAGDARPGEVPATRDGDGSTNQVVPASGASASDASESDVSDSDVAESSVAASDPSAFRQRDYRPDGARASFASAFAPGEADAEGSEAGPRSSRADTDLAAPERTMTRRELRILRARAEAAGLPAPDVMFLPNGESTVTGAIPVLDGEAFSGRPAVAPEADAAGVVTEKPIFDGGAEREPGSERSADVGPVEPTPLTSDPEALVEDAEPVTAVIVDADGAIDVEPVDSDVIPALVEPQRSSPARFPFVAAAASSDVPAEIVVDAEPATADDAVSTADPVDVPESPESASEEDGSPAPGRLRPFDALFLPPSARADTEEPADPLLETAAALPANDTDGLRGDILAAPAGAARPFGHWSTQNDDDDVTSEAALSRDVGTGVLTTHALVLPSIPDAGEPLMSPLTSTGEVMVTGIVELPKSFGTTGAHPALFDHPEVDSIIENADREDADSGAAPVRATRAVSSTTTTRSMVEAAPTRHSRVLPIIGIAVGSIVLVGAALWALATFVFTSF